MNKYLPGEHPRARRMRLDAASLLKRFFMCEQSLMIGEAGWLASMAPFEVKTTLPRLLWEDAMTAHALRERVFELRFPSRLMDTGYDAPLIQVFDEAIHAPCAEAFVLSLARVFKPALLTAYREYLAQSDEIADGPTLRFMGLAVQEKTQQVSMLMRMAEQMLSEAPELQTQAETWAAALEEQLAALGGVAADRLAASSTPLNLPGRRAFSLAEAAVRDPRFYLCRFYWPDNFDPTFPYGEGIRLQLRSAVSHLNEIWAVETAGAILHAFARPLGWEFVFDAARWCYDESRHCRMGYERLRHWGFEVGEMPLGSYIYDSARGQDPIYRLGMLFFFETKNIGKKTERIKAFQQYHDVVSQHDMDYDWADETIHANFGQHWLKALFDAQYADAETVHDSDAVRVRCGQLVEATVTSVTPDERADTYRLAQAMIDKAERFVFAHA